jgi:hypothetical protein
MYREFPRSGAEESVVDRTPGPVPGGLAPSVTPAAPVRWGPTGGSINAGSVAWMQGGGNAATARAVAAAGPLAALDPEQDAMIQTLSGEVTNVLLPAYRAAVDAIDPPAALQLAMAIMEGYRRLRGLQPVPGPLAGPAPLPDERITRLTDLLAREIGPQRFRGQLVLGQSVAHVTGDPLTYLADDAGMVVNVLITVLDAKRLLGDDATPSWTGAREAVEQIERFRSRPVTFFFMQEVLRAEGLWTRLAGVPGPSGRSLGDTAEAVRVQWRETGAFLDVGEFDRQKMESLLTYSAGDWAITDEDAMGVARMVMSASPPARGPLLAGIDGMGLLTRLCENLPWKYVQAMEQGMQGPDEVKTRLREYWQSQGGGESLSKMYDDQIMDNLAEGDNVAAFGWTYLATAHNALTFGFLSTHDAAYDAAQEGWISSDAYYSTTAKAAARSAAIAGVTIASGGAAGAFGEGVALGLGAGRTAAQLIGGGFGGAVSGVAGQATTDAFDLALMGKEWEDVDGGNYLLAGGLGAGTGLLTAGVAAAGSRYLPNSAKTMSQTYAERYPQLDNVLTRLRNSGIRTGLATRVTGQELIALVDSGLVGAPNALERLDAVYGNRRIEIPIEDLTKVFPQSDIERMYGPVDPATGAVAVPSGPQSGGGFVGAAPDVPPGGLSTDANVRQTFGLDTNAQFYAKYHAGEPLFEVTFRTTVELDVPLPQENAVGVPLGSVDPATHHVPGAGRTAGGVREGTLPRGSAIEILSIRPIGKTHTTFPSTGQPYGPYPVAPPAVRPGTLPAPAGGAVGGSTNPRDDRRRR